MFAQIEDDALDVELRQREEAGQIVVVVRVVVRMAEVGGVDDGDLRLGGLRGECQRNRDHEHHGKEFQHGVFLLGCGKRA